MLGGGVESLAAEAAAERFGMIGRLATVGRAPRARPGGAAIILGTCHHPRAAGRQSVRAEARPKGCRPACCGTAIDCAPRVTRRPWVGCVHGVIVSSLHRRGSRKYCSKHCNDIAKKKRRQALKRNPKIKPPSIGYILRRDRGICQLCGEKVDPTAKWPDGRMPSMDHIVPLSEGGSDRARNIQLAHLRCNQAKKDNKCGSQLRLVG